MHSLNLVLLFAIVSFSIFSCQKESSFNNIKKSATIGTDIPIFACESTVEPTLPASDSPYSFNLLDFHNESNGMDFTDAFLDASIHINELCQVLNGSAIIYLNIPAGIYNVGKQLKPGECYPSCDNPVFENDYSDTRHGSVRKGVDILSFIGCDGLVINGEEGTVIRFKDSLYFGGYREDAVTIDDDLNNNIEDNSDALFITNHPDDTDDKRHRATIGNIIRLQDCNCVRISNIELDGNVPESGSGFLGGKHEIGKFGGSFESRQLTHSGIDIWNSSNITIRNIHTHHFGLDGIRISDVPEEYEGTTENIYLSNVNSEYNCRQGLSWTGGSNLFVSNSSFNYTGYVDGGASFINPPGAGIDIEPGKDHMVENGNFYNCEMIGNSGAADLISFKTTNTVLNLDNINFNNCLFSGQNTKAIILQNTGNINFDNCNFTGMFRQLTAIPESEIIIRNSTITDVTMDGNPSYAIQGATVSNTMLLDIVNGDNFRFENNTFKLHNRKLIHVVSTDTPPQNGFFDNNEFDIYVDELNDNLFNYIGHFRYYHLTNNNFNSVFSSSQGCTNPIQFASELYDGSNIITGCEATSSCIERTIVDTDDKDCDAF